MKYLALILSLFFVKSFTGEYRASFTLKHIQIPHALELFYMQALPSGKTVVQELASNKITLLFGRETNCILLHGTNEETVFLVRDLIQNHVDKA